MKYFKWLMLIVYATCFCMVGCEDKTVIDPTPSGYLQVRLVKDIITRTVTGEELDYLDDAKKISLTLVFENKTIVQTLKLSSVSSEASEYGLISDKLELKSGKYILSGYKILGSEVVNGQLEVLQEVIPDSPFDITIENRQIARVELGAISRLRGNLSFVLKKDFSNIDVPATKGALQDETLFNYRDVYGVEISYYKDKGEKPVTHLFKTRFNKNERLLSTDTLSVAAGVYSMTQVRFLKKDLSTLLMVQDVDQTFEVKDVTLQYITRDSINVIYPKNMLAIRDYIALYNIWKKMDGPNWGYIGEAFSTGVNWVFKNRPIDEWGLQPGVDIKTNGRVSALNLGAFNPLGQVPDEIGVLTELEQLWLGTHSEEAIIDLDGVETLDTYMLHRNGIDRRANRMEIGKERMALIHRMTGLSEMMSSIVSAQAKPRKYTSKYGYNVGSPSNRITGISEEIGNCKALTSLFIANNFITSLPERLKELELLEELEIYNTKITEVPAGIGQLPLVVLNLSHNKEIAADDLYKGLTRLFDQPLQNTLQLLYCNSTQLKKIPENLVNVTKIGLLDLANNKIEGKLDRWGRNIAPIQLYLENNKITEVPDDLCNFDDMESFSISMNKIRVFPKISSADAMYVISSLDFSDNEIERFSAGFSGVYVETLNLSNNHFHRVSDIMPSDLAQTNSRIKNLAISGDTLRKVHKSSVLGLTLLQALDLSGNRIDTLTDEFWTGNFPVFAAIDISNNCFKKFPSRLLYLSTLGSLYVNDQFDDAGRRTLKEWPANVEKHFTLRTLQLRGNDIRKVSSNFPILLNSLDVSDNPNLEMTIPKVICDKIINGTFLIGYDVTQNISGCEALGIEK